MASLCRMASLCSKPTGIARLPGRGEGGDLSVNCRPGCHATGYLLLKQGRYIFLFIELFANKCYASELFTKLLGPIVQRVLNAIHRINHCE